MIVGESVRVLAGVPCHSWIRELHSRNEGKVGTVARIWAMDGSDGPDLDFDGMEDHHFFVEFPDRHASSYTAAELERVSA